MKKKNRDQKVRLPHFCGGRGLWILEDRVERKVLLVSSLRVREALFLVGPPLQRLPQALASSAHAQVTLNIPPYYFRFSFFSFLSIGFLDLLGWVTHHCMSLLHSVYCLGALRVVVRRQRYWLWSDFDNFKASMAM